MKNSGVDTRVIQDQRPGDGDNALAYAISRKIGMDPGNPLEEEKRIEAMRVALIKKIRTHPDLKDSLEEAVKNNVLWIEASRLDLEWGSGPKDGQPQLGKNLLGILLTEIMITEFNTDMPFIRNKPGCGSGVDKETRSKNVLSELRSKYDHLKTHYPHSFGHTFLASNGNQGVVFESTGQRSSLQLQKECRCDGRHEYPPNTQEQARKPKNGITKAAQPKPKPSPTTQVATGKNEWWFNPMPNGCVKMVFLDENGAQKSFFFKEETKPGQIAKSYISEKDKCKFDENKKYFHPAKGESLVFLLRDVLAAIANGPSGGPAHTEGWRIQSNTDGSGKAVFFGGKGDVFVFQKPPGSSTQWEKVNLNPPDPALVFFARNIGADFDNFVSPDLPAGLAVIAQGDSIKSKKMIAAPLGASQPQGERSTGQAPWYHSRPKGRGQAVLARCLLYLDALYNA